MDDAGPLEGIFPESLITNSQIIISISIGFSITVFGQSGTPFELLLLK